MLPADGLVVGGWPEELFEEVCCSCGVGVTGVLQFAGEAEADERPPKRPKSRGMERPPLEREGVPRGIDSGSDCTLGASWGNPGAGGAGCSAMRYIQFEPNTLIEIAR